MVGNYILVNSSTLAFWKQLYSVQVRKYVNKCYVFCVFIITYFCFILFLQNFNFLFDPLFVWLFCFYEIFLLNAEKK